MNLTSRQEIVMSKEQFMPGIPDSYEEKYDHPIKAFRKDTEEIIYVRIMAKDEMPDDGNTYYVDTRCSIYPKHKNELEIL